MFLAVIASVLIYSWVTGVPLQTKGTPQFEVYKEWIVDTRIEDDNSFRKTHRMKPLLIENSVIQGNAIDGIVSYDRNTGRKLWNFAVVGGVESGVVHVNDRLFFGGNDGKFYSININTGKLIWSFDAKTEVISEPAIWDGIVYFLAGNNVFYALDAAEGRDLWIYSRVDSQNFSIRGASTPVVINGILYMGFTDGYIVGLDAKSGAVKWEQVLNKNKKFKDLDSSPIIDDDQIFITGYDSAIYSVNRMTGQLIWKSDTGGYGDVLLYKDFLIYSTSQSQIIALNKTNGSKLWTYNLTDGVGNSPVIYQDKVVVTQSQGPVLFLNPTNGKLITQFDSGRGSFSPLAIDQAKNELYFISKEALLYKLKTKERDLNQEIYFLQ